MSPLWLKTIHAYDRLRFAQFRARFRGRLRVAEPSAPNLRLADVRVEPGASLEFGTGFAMERRRANTIWVQRDARVAFGERAWLRTECGENRITAFPDALVEVGPDALWNGAMVHAREKIVIGSTSWLGFGVRVLDSDLHQIDVESPVQTQPVRIGDRVWVGADVLVLRGVTIGDDTVVAAGSIVTRDLPSRCLAMGRPARPVREIGSRKGCV